MPSQTAASAPHDFAAQSPPPRHVAMIMDGNRRWARQRGLSAVAGHRAGLERLIELLPAVAARGIEVLTLFAFSSANWRRAADEVDNLMRLMRHALPRLRPLCLREDVAVEIIGRTDRLPAALGRELERLTDLTRGGARRLRIAFDYSSRAAILDAARNAVDADSLSRQLDGNRPCDVDLLIRTGREQRLSDFLLWECAFAELYFPDLYWPEFDARALEEALAWYHGRERRFGA